MTTNLNTLLNNMIKVSVNKTTMSKYLDLARMGKEAAKIADDKKAKRIFNSELIGYRGDVPNYRKFGKRKVTTSIGNMIHIFEKNSNNMNATTMIGGKRYRLKTLKSILVNGFESYVWAFIGNIMKEYEESEESLPQIDMSGLPDEVAELLAGVG